MLFPGPTAFDAALTGLRFDARYLALALRRDERALQQMLQRALPLTVLPYRRDRLLVQRVRQTLASQAQQTHNAEALATLLQRVAVVQAAGMSAEARAKALEELERLAAALDVPLAELVGP